MNAVCSGVNLGEDLRTMVSEVMTRNAETIAPDNTLRERADLIDRLTVGALPICDG
jgi:CBS domain-containing protein